MKRLIVLVCASVLLLTGGSGAMASQDNNPVTLVVLKYGKLARLGNTVEVCLAARISVTVITQPEQMAPTVACYPSKKGPPVVGTHVNQAMWVKGPSGEDSLIPAIGRWVWLKGAKSPYISITDLWLPSDWGVLNVRFNAVVPSKDQLLGKVKVRVKPHGGFVPQGVPGDIEHPACGFSGVAAGCHYQDFAGAKKLLNITFWPPWGPRQVQVLESFLDLDCTYTNDDGSQTLGCPSALPRYPPP